MKRICLHVLPYFSCLLVAVLFFVIALNLKDDYKALLQNLSASFLAMPCLLLGYEIIKNLVNLKLNKKIFDYAKVKVDSNVLSILNQTQKIVYTYNKRNATFEGLNELLNLSQFDILNQVKNNEYMGFQVLKQWELPFEHLQKVLENSFILQKLGNEQIISIISLLKDIQSLNLLHQRHDLFNISSQTVSGYKVITGKELNNANTQYLDRYILLEMLNKQDGTVVDFGDFLPIHHKDLLNICYIKDEFLEILANNLYDVLQGINKWGKITGGEFLIDTKEFRLKKITKQAK